MSYIRMNAKVAKQLGAFPHKDLHKHTTPGSYIIDCSTGEAHCLPTDNNKYEEFCSHQPYGRPYYKAVPTDSPLYNKCKEAANVSSQISSLQEQLKRLEEIQDNWCTELQKGMQESIVTNAVLFLHGDGSHDLTVQDFNNEITLRKEDQLLALGKRYGKKGERTLWIAMIEVAGLITSQVKISRIYRV